MFPCNQASIRTAEHHLSMQVHQSATRNGQRKEVQYESILHLKVQQAVRFRLLESGNTPSCLEPSVRPASPIFSGRHLQAIEMLVLMSRVEPRVPAVP